MAKIQFRRDEQIDWSDENEDPDFLSVIDDSLDSDDGYDTPIEAQELVFTDKNGEEILKMDEDGFFIVRGVPVDVDLEEGVIVYNSFVDFLRANGHKTPKQIKI